MRPLLIVLASSLTTGAAMFYAGRITADSPEAGGASGNSKVVVERSGPPRAASNPAAAGGPLQNTAGKAVNPWASLHGKDGKIPAEAMDDAVRRIMTNGNPVDALENFSALLKELTPENASAAWKAMQAQAQGPDGMRYLPLLSYSWGAMDGPAALKALNEDGGREGRTGSMSAIGGWAAKDPQAALAWLKEFETANKPEAGAAGEGERRGRDDGGARMLKFGLVNGLAQSDPAAAMSLISTLEPNERGRMVGVVAQKELKQGVESASQWATSIQDPEMRKSAMASVAREYANQDPAKAAAWLTSAGGGAVDADAAGNVAGTWVTKDPGAAMEWVAKLPAGETQSEAYEDAFRSWARTDPTASSTYLNSMSAGPSKDAAIGSLARSIAGEDPSAAVQWAGTISDEKTRTETLIRTAQAWNAQDSAAAQEWIGSSGFPPEVQQQMLQQNNRGGRDRGGFDRRGGGGFGRGGRGGRGG